MKNFPWQKVEERLNLKFNIKNQYINYNRFQDETEVLVSIVE